MPATGRSRDLQHLLETGDAGCAPPAVATTVGKTGHWVLPGASAGESQLVHAGRPDLSAVVQRMRSRRPASQMAPVGSVVVDREAVDLVTAWVAAGARAAATCRTSASP